MTEIFAFLGSDTTKISVTVISTVVGIFLTRAKIKSILPRPRLFLKEDIEILNSLDKNQEEYKIVSEYIRNRIRVIYSGQDEKSILFGTKKSLPNTLGALMILSGIYLTYAVHESTSWSSWWYIGTVYIAIIGYAIMSIRDTVSRDAPIQKDGNQEDNSQI